MEDLRKELQERFTDYVSFYTTSEEGAEKIPSTARQFNLARHLCDELRALGIEDAEVSHHCYVYGTLPATPDMEDRQTTGFIAHLDTAPSFSGENVKPQIIENYDGGDVVLKGSGAVLSPMEFSDLTSLKGRTLITSDGTTLLGEDVKAGVTEIMTAVAYLLKHPEISHGKIRIAFTPDEEVGKGPERFDVEGFGADYAYTVDGGAEGEISYENFNAASARVTMDGVNVHTGSAKGIMVNAALLAATFAADLPRNMTPAETEGREGFFHLEDIHGDVNHAECSFLIRDHDAGKFADKKALLERRIEELRDKYPTGTFTLEISDTYKNMYPVMEQHPKIIALAKNAITLCGMTPVSDPVRGGTDGAQLTYKGLPCPNLGTGGYAFHGPFEHITLEGMQKAAEVVIYIACHPLGQED